MVYVVACGWISLPYFCGCLFLFDRWHGVATIPRRFVRMCVVFAKFNLAPVFHHFFTCQCFSSCP